MALPDNLTTREVIGQYMDLAGSYVTGNVEFTIEPVLSDGAAGVVIVPTPRIAPLDEEGKFSIFLLVTDDPDVNPTGFRYRVTEKLTGLTGRQPFYLDVPGNSAVPIDLSKIVTIPPTDGTTTYVSQAALDDETSARVAADNTESAARIAADDAESTARETADTAETAAREQAIVNEQTARTQAISDEHDDRVQALAAETLARTQADSDEQTAREQGDADQKTYTDDQVILLIPLTQKGAASGVAPLGADSRVPVAFVPDLSATYVTDARVAVANGVASLDVDGKVPSSQLPEIPTGDQLGIYVPSDWGQFWKPKRDAAGAGIATVAAVGSSSTQGLYAANLLTTSFVSRIMTSLQATYGDGGSGFFSTVRSLTFMGADTTSNAWNALAGNFATVTGSWDIGNSYGPSANYIYTTTPGDKITFTKVRGTKIRIYTMSGAGRANWTYSIDGGAAVNVADSGTPQTSVQVTSINGLPAGDHTVVMTHAGAAASSFSVCGVTGENATGIVMNNFGQSGAQAATFMDATNAWGAGRWSGGPDYPADLVIYALGANDAAANVTGDTWAVNMRKFLQGVRDGSTVGGVASTGQTDILIFMQHIGKYDNASLKWQDYVSRVRGIAEAYGAALVDMWTLGRNSWNYANSLGYWGNAAVAGGVAGTDEIHMSDTGHQAMANAILPILTAA